MMRPSVTIRSNLPTALERAGDFSQTRITNGNIQPIIDPQTGQPFQNNIIPLDRISPLGQAMLNLLPMPNGILNLAARAAVDVELGVTTRRRSTAAPNNVIRIDQTFTDKTRASFKLLKDRDDVWSYNNFTPGTGHVANNAPGIIASSTITQVLRPNDRQRDELRIHAQPLGFHAGPETEVGKNFDYTTLYAAKLGINAPRLHAVRATIRIRRSSPGFGGPQVDEWPCAPVFATGGGNRAGLAGYMNQLQLPAPAPEHERARILGGRPVDHEGAPQPQGGRLPRIQQEDGARVDELPR